MNGNQMLEIFNAKGMNETVHEFTSHFLKEDKFAKQQNKATTKILDLAEKNELLVFIWSKEEVEALSEKVGTVAHYRKWLAQFKQDVGSDEICDQIVDTY